MIGDAVMLMFFGMGAVFVFLVLLSITISLLAYCTGEHTRKEEIVLAEEELARRKKKKRAGTGGSNIPVVAISAAVHAYRSS